MPCYTHSICSPHYSAGHVFKLKRVTKNARIQTNLQICKLINTSPPSWHWYEHVKATRHTPSQLRRGHSSMESRCWGIKCSHSLWLHVDMGSLCVCLCLTGGLKGLRGKGKMDDRSSEQRSDKTVDWYLRRPCYVIVIIACLCKLVCDDKLW